MRSTYNQAQPILYSLSRLEYLRKVINSDRDDKLKEINIIEAEIILALHNPIAPTKYPKLKYPMDKPNAIESYIRLAERCLVSSQPIGTIRARIKDLLLNIKRLVRENIEKENMKL